MRKKEGGNEKRKKGEKERRKEGKKEKKKGKEKKRSNTLELALDVLFTVEEDSLRARFQLVAGVRSQRGGGGL